MSTSLAAQLKRLAIPQTKALVDSKQRASLLFDPLEAAKLSKEDLFKVGCEGIKKLIEIDSEFSQFKDLLFSNDTKFVQRAVEGKETNKKFDKLISRFCIRLSPYLLLKAAHKALEWLIFRYQIHELNATQLFALILPYHEANIFVRILQLVDLNSSIFKSWAWLQPIQKNGLTLPRRVLVNHAISDTSFLRFICETTERALKEHMASNSVVKLRTQLAFYTSTLVGVFSSGSSDDHILTVALPSILAGLTSPVEDYKSASYMTIGQLMTNNQLETELAANLLKKIMDDSSEDFCNQRVYLLLLMFQRQDAPPALTYDFVKDWDWVIPILAELSKTGTYIAPLVLTIVRALLDRILDQSEADNEQDASAQVFCWNLLDKVDCDELSASKLLWALSSYHEKLLKKPAEKGIKRKNASEPEISEGANIDLADWLKSLIETICVKYVSSFDKINSLEFQNLRRQWAGDEQDKALSNAIVALVRKCAGSSHSEAWRQLKPLLLKQIEDKRYFKAWCKSSPTTEPLTLLLIFERLLRPTATSALRKALITKISDQQFGSKNPCIQILKTAYDNNSEIAINDAMDKMLENWKNDASARYEISKWITAVNELKDSKIVSSVNAIWVYALRMMIHCIPSSANAEKAVEIAMAFSNIATLKTTVQATLISELITAVKAHAFDGSGWVDVTQANLSICLRLKTMELCFCGVNGTDKHVQKFQELFQTFVTETFNSSEEAYRFISAVSAGSTSNSLNSELLPPLLQIHAVHHLWLRASESDNMISILWDKLICYLLVALCNESFAVRTAAVNLLQALDQLSLQKSLHKLLSELCRRSKEINTDFNHVSIGLYCYLSGKNVKRDTNFLIAILTDAATPLYIASKINYLMDTIATAQIMKDLVPLARRALESKDDVHIVNDILNIYWKRLNNSTADVLEDETVWDLAKNSLAHHRSDEQCPAVSFIKSVDKDLFTSLPLARQIALLELLISTRAETTSSDVTSAIASACRKIPLTGSVVLPILEKMINSFPKTLNVSSSTVLEGGLWRWGIYLLEIVQGKKKLYESKMLVRPLFVILKFCLDQEEQTPFEYAKQLVLGCLLEITERNLDGPDKIDGALLDVELIIQCLRASSNPQTHHHALLLLACLGAIIPMQVMHNMMAIFTFMGSSVTRLDDEHSVQVVTKVVDAIVPVLVDSLHSKGTEGETVVAEVIRIFVWTLRDVPQHRRTPLLTRLITTLDPDRCLWQFLLLLFENYVLNAHKGEKNTDGNMPDSLQLGMELALSFGPKIVLNTSLKLIRYLTDIPLVGMHPAREEYHSKFEYLDSKGLFDIKKHTPKQLRHYTYTLITFLNSLLADQNLILQVRELDVSEAGELESVFKDSIAALLLYAPTCSAQQLPVLAKFWKVLTSLSYDVLDRLVALISSDTLVGVITKLLKQSEDTLKKKAIDLLNVHVQSHRGGFTAEEKASLSKLVAPVLQLAVAPVEEESAAAAAAAAAEAHTIQQAALLSLRLFAKVLASEDLDTFKQVLTEVSKLCKLKGHLLASAALTVADLVAHIKARAVSELPHFLPALLKALSKYVDGKSTDIVLMSVCAAMYRIVESLAAFLSPYMAKLVYYISCLATLWPDASDLNRKLLQIRQKLASGVPHRVLIPAFGRCYQQLIDEKKFSAIGPLLSLLADSLAGVADVSKLLTELAPFFIKVLQLRSDAADGIVTVSDEDVLFVEGYAIDSLITLVLKLSELSFKPLYYQIFHWVSEHPHRAITFYRLSCKLAEGLKGLFVLFAGHFLNNAASLLDATNVTKTETPHFGPGAENEARAILLLESIVQTLLTVFMFDSTQFLNKDKFQALLSPLVDQLENTLGGAEALEERTGRLLTPCLAHMTLASDDTQWKQLNYQLLTKTHNSSPLIRIAALKTIVEVAAKLGENYLPLLPETIGSLAELLEDEDERVEMAMKDALRKMEDDLGQPIREYFQ